MVAARKNAEQARRLNKKRCRVCFVTGTRAEFGLMQRTLRAIAQHPQLQLQLVVTGMHLDHRRGATKREIASEWKIDATVPWLRGERPAQIAASTGEVIARMARTFERLKSDIILVVGDRVEAFAAAAAGQISQRVVAHVHGGDRALGQVDDCLRHAITKLAHVHFPATSDAADRIAKLGEARGRIHRVGSPGVEGIAESIDPNALCAHHAQYEVAAGRFALLLVHPTSADDGVERRRACAILRALLRSRLAKIVCVYPNNDPGSGGIIRALEEEGRGNPQIVHHRHVPRELFLGLMRDAAVLIGNSSSGIIEAASFGTPVIDIGPRQLGRACGPNVIHVSHSDSAIRAALRAVELKRKRARANNIYAAPNTAQRIARTLATTRLDAAFRAKLITY